MRVDPFKSRLASIGHNGGPTLDDPAPVLRSDWCCARCRHWNAPGEREEADYRAYVSGASKRRVKEPSGSCDRVLHRPGGLTSFSGTMGRSRCYNFEDKPVPIGPQHGQAFVRIYRGDAVVWEGREGDEPAEYRQGELAL